LTFQVQGSGFRVQGSRFQVQGSKFKDSTFDVRCSMFDIPGGGFPIMTLRQGCILILVLLCLVGCFPKAKKPTPISYYTLEYQAPDPRNLPPLPVTLKFYRLETAPPYRTDRMVYRGSAFKWGKYDYHRWQIEPGRLATYFLVRDFRNTSLFKAALPPESIVSSSHFLSGTVDEFYQEEDRETWKAVLAVSITLAAERGRDTTGEVLIQKSYREEEPLERKNPTALAGAMSRAMERISERMVRDVYEALSSM
jgi:ABC-type uncharacterized transport system auxiliary subunit